MLIIEDLLKEIDRLKKTKELQKACLRDIQEICKKENSSFSERVAKIADIGLKEK